jgi:hypothetical protein
VEVRQVVAKERCIAHPTARFLSRVGFHTRRMWDEAYENQSLIRAPDVTVVRSAGSVGWTKNFVERSCTYTYLNYTLSDVKHARLTTNAKYKTFFVGNKYRPVNCAIVGATAMPKRFRLTGPEADEYYDPNVEDDDEKEEKDVEQLKCYRNEVHPNEV